MARQFIALGHGRQEGFGRYARMLRLLSQPSEGDIPEVAQTILPQSVRRRAGFS